ncbi:uncharacterized protein LOC102804545 [Saccoglossus kowalevskii]|uniref:DNA-directed RNA polymerase I subunit RPA43-like n=1 Tax=Saccoglossus kowalevskii TaxID=10224 RepID=A0ABM0M4C3_SACKO|nr:PREDICTED: DNA-directed RNA polymerase I subunit RPA43-like [Saccoglossus kowalevskii]
MTGLIMFKLYTYIILNGVLIAYENIQLFEASCEIVDDQPCIHFDVQLDTIVFQPSVGSKLKGVVRKIGIDHIGCLVHGCFNSSVPKPDNAINGWKGGTLVMGQEVILQVDRLDALRGVLSIKGHIVQVMPYSGTNTVDEVIESNLTELDNPVKHRVEVSTNDETKKTKRKRNKSEDVSEESTDEAFKAETRKKSKKKHKRQKTENVNSLELSTDPEQCEHSSKKSKKKHKRQKLENVDSSELSPDPEQSEYVSKKSKKKLKREKSHMTEKKNDVSDRELQWEDVDRSNDVRTDTDLHKTKTDTYDMEISNTDESKDYSSKESKKHKKKKRKKNE